MMLAALCDLAKREGLADDSALERRRVDFILKISAEGKLLGVVGTHGEDGRAKEFIVPRLPKRTVAVTPALLVDNAKYVLGIVPADGSADPARIEKCALAFADAAASFAAGIHDEGLTAVNRFLANRHQNRPALFSHRPPSEWTGGEWVAFQLDGDSELVHERRTVLRGLQAKALADDGSSSIGQCLVTGLVGPIERLHPPVKGIPDAQTSGATLVSFNTTAFESQGLRQGANAPVGVAAAREYTAALNWLLGRQGGRRHRYGVSLGDSVLIFWTRTKGRLAEALAEVFAPSESKEDVTGQPSAAEGLFDELFEASGEEAARAFESPLRGTEPAEVDRDAFYALTLSGHSRVIVRDWLETTTGAVKENLKRYWNDLRLSGGDKTPRPIWKLLASAAGPSGQGLSPDLASRLMRCALLGSPFPRELLGASLRRLRLPPGKYEVTELRDRVSLVKAVLNRKLRQSNEKEITVALDESCKATPYLLGRLFAVLERLQGAALGDVNATIREKFFGSASATPALVFPRLLKLSVHHFAKANAGWLEKIKSEIVDALPAQPFPSTLPLDDQGFFAVGYYHQRQRFFEKREPVATPAAPIV